jgi:outer membrane protein OmpA-like peptidoglycan-associated protein
MKSVLNSGITALLILALGSAGSAQVPNPTQVPVQSSGENPLYRVTINVVERDIKAVNYRVRGGDTQVDFKGTALMPEAKGKAIVEGKKGYVDIDVNFDEVRPASMFGPEYLTYVLWAITPEGRATNLGEVILGDDESKLHVTTELQAFGMIVTAEPYFAVAQPSDVVVLENVIRKDTEGTTSTIDAKFDLLKRGQYVVNAYPADLKPLPIDKKTPLDLLQARNAVRIAEWAGAKTNAPDTYQKARMLLDQAEAQQVADKSKKTVSTVARESVQAAEDARLVTLKRVEEARLAAERKAVLDREAAARADEAAARAKAEQEANARAQSDAARRLEIERAARAEAAERAALEKADAARADAERARQEARLAAEQADREKADLRAELQKQLNLVLETRETARGLIVNMSDVLFDTAQHTLKPGAQERLAKVAEILKAHPGLQIEIEGHTDSVGTDSYNQSLSERRAQSVRSFLVTQGVPSQTMSARGFGEAQPVASNDSASGRQQNRRVELVVAGEVIGTASTARIVPR